MGTVIVRGFNKPTGVMMSPEELAFHCIALLPTGQFFNYDSNKVPAVPTTETIPLLWTGEYGKEQTRIFDGDVVRFDFLWDKDTGNENQIGLVGRIFYTEAMWCVQTREGEEFSINRISNAEVIGNIYQHPHLLPLSFNPNP